MRAWATSLLVLLVSACATPEIRPTFERIEFDLSGRLAARYKQEAFTGNLSWRHAAQADELLLSTPLGQGVARIARQGDAVMITTAEGREVRASDAESLTERVLGFRLPLAGLADWVRARPSTDTPGSGEFFPDGKLKSLEQRGWKIEYLEYAGTRPSLVRMTYPGIELRLAITQWK